MAKNKFQLKREATYQALLESGLQCFAEKGYAATTIKDIVARTGHTQGAFYGHFASKEEFFPHVLAYQQQRTRGWSEIPGDCTPANTTLEEILTMVVTRLGQTLPGFDRWILVLVDFYQNTHHDPKARSLLETKYREWVDGIVELVETLKARGWVILEKDARQVARQIIAFNEGCNVFAALAGEADLPTLIQGLVKLLS